METLDKATTFATWFKEFIQHAELMSIVLALVCSWGFALWARFPFRQKLATAWVAWALWTVEIVVAGFICGILWPAPEANWKLAWALTVGVSSPLMFVMLAWVVGWKWPPLKPYLFLGAVTPPELTPDTGDDCRLPPP